MDDVNITKKNSVYFIETHIFFWYNVENYPESKN